MFVRCHHFVFVLIVVSCTTACGSGLHPGPGSKKLAETCSGPFDCVDGLTCLEQRCLERGDFPRQWGGADLEGGTDVKVGPDGQIVLVGWGVGSFDGQSPHGRADGFVTQLDQHGTKHWTRQLGTRSVDGLWALDLGPDGSAYVVGWEGGLIDVLTGNDGSAEAGVDAFVAKLEQADGAIAWKQLWPEEHGGAALAVAVMGSHGVHVAGFVMVPVAGQERAQSDVLLRKYGLDEELLWTARLASDQREWPYAAAVDTEGHVYVAGATYGDLAGRLASSKDDKDAFLAKFGPEGGKPLWIKQWGTDEDDWAEGLVVAPSGEVYAVGTMGAGDRQASGLWGRADAFVRRWEPDGTPGWVHRWTSPSSDGATAVDIGASGQVIVVGTCSDTMDEADQHGSQDIFISQFSPHGDRAWTHTDGTLARDVASGVALTPDNRIVVTGNTYGNLGAQNRGNGDVFVLLHDPAAAP